MSLSFTSPTEPLAKLRSKYILELLNSGKRVDGRGLHAYRELKIEVNPIEKANGSAMVTLGKTKVLVGVKVEAGKPYPDTPNEGVLTVNAEFVPLAHEFFEPGPPDENSIELARVVDRGIRESKAIELEKLVIVAGKLVYVIFIDVYILNHDGNLIDASGFAALAALSTLKLPVYEVEDEEKVKAKDEFVSLPIRDFPVPSTLVKIHEKLVLDPSGEEEQIANAKITLTLTRDQRLCALQKSGPGALTFEDVLEAHKIAVEKSIEIREKIFSAVRG